MSQAPSGPLNSSGSEAPGAVLRFCCTDAMFSRDPRRPSWSRLSAFVRSGARCESCGTREDLVAHHRIPRRLGGPDSLENLVALCRTCHPTVEGRDRAEAELEWESPVPEGAPDPRPPRRLPRPY